MYLPGDLAEADRSVKVLPGLVACQRLYLRMVQTKLFEAGEGMHYELPADPLAAA